MGFKFGLDVVPFYAGILTLLYIGLTARVINLRRLLRVGIGSGGKEELKRAIRVHANFSEFVPLVLILMAFAELKGISANWLHTIGSVMIVSRLLHALGLGNHAGTSPGRFSGAALTYLVMIGLSLYLMIKFLK
ncbi:MAG: hypothetical protein EP326_15960 [Deltaproteobacteria bacterium]|nr:MAG: hypothetical protein EP326_15960 [Deltaproteobacteria bacterium]TNF26677.1 MAG: hypothetical protein EP319_13265 [Deltaproteobacteria bacterium]